MATSNDEGREPQDDDLLSDEQLASMRLRANSSLAYGERNLGPLAHDVLALLRHAAYLSHTIGNWQDVYKTWEARALEAEAKLKGLAASGSHGPGESPWRLTFALPAGPMVDWSALTQWRDRLGAQEVRVETTPPRVVFDPVWSTREGLAIIAERIGWRLVEATSWQEVRPS